MGRAKITEGEFWKHVLKTDGCWIWDRIMPSTGEGSFGYMRPQEYMWVKILKRDLPNGMIVQQACWNKECVRPEHLAIVTQEQHRRYEERVVNLEREYKQDGRLEWLSSPWARFWSKVIKRENGCWDIQTKHPYPQVSYLGESEYAHRFVWIHILQRDAPKGMELHHKCDNPWCVNPNHLELKTKSAHTSERWAAERKKREELNQ